jgi:8-oxo-dGTP pyrophosphatase MutT (NUDIX family)/nucleoside 2-deoxyribosyltransferase
MKVVYANQELPESWTKSIFLAGPTPRSSDVASWRPEALRILEKKGYDGVVFVPEDEQGKWQHSYVDQVGWEERCLNACDCVVFWIPRDVATMPGFTTNIELGVWLDSGKAVVGFPERAPKTRYIEHYTDKLNIPGARTLNETLTAAMIFLGKGVERKGGSRKVPLFIYNTKHFQDWLVGQEAVGNRLDDAKLLWNFRVGPHRKFPLFWAIHVDVYVAAEDRNKSNELIISRTDISSVLAYKPGKTLMDTQVCMVREFRSPSSTPDSFIWELPGGSSPKADQDPFEIASEELHEETGLKLAKERFQRKRWGRRQLAGTVTTHGSWLFYAELNDKDLAYLVSQKGIMHGNHITDSEQTYVEVVTVKQLLEAKEVGLCDWATLGMILSVLVSNTSD